MGGEDLEVENKQVVLEDLEVENKQVVLKGYIEEGDPNETDLQVMVGKIKLKVPKGSGAFLVQNLYLSCDPYMRGRTRQKFVHLPSFIPGKPLEGFGVSKVVDSDNPNFKPGDLISWPAAGWEEYSLVHRTDDPQFRKIKPDDDIPLSFHVGLLGMPGFTAYAGFYEVCSPKKGEYVYVSAASGAVGQLVGQLAKLHGCYVVGSAGSSQKVDLLKNKLGFDEAFNYKDETDLDAALKRYFPKGIDIYFENVGGKMLDAVLLNMRVHGRICVCGMVSVKSPSDPNAVFNLFSLIPKRIKMQGLMQSDYLHLFPRFLEHVGGYYKQGKIVYIEDMTEGLDSAPSALVGIFSGKNVGKQIIRVADHVMHAG